MTARRKPTNLSIREDVMDEIRKYNLNASQIAEEALTAALKAARQKAWLDENAEAISSFNDRVERGELFNKGLRRF